MFKIIIFTAAVIVSATADSPLSLNYINTEKQRLDELVNKLKLSYNQDVDPCKNYVDYVTGNLEPIRKYISEPDIQFYKDIYNYKTPDSWQWEQLFNSCYYNLSDNFKESVGNIDFKEIEDFQVLFDDKGVTNEESYRWYRSHTNVLTLAQLLVPDEPIYNGFGFTDIPKISLPILMKFNFLDDNNEPEMFRDLFEDLGYTSDEITNIKAAFKRLQEKLISMDSTLLNNMNSQFKNYVIRVTDRYADEFLKIFDETDQKDLSHFLFYIIFGMLHDTHNKILQNKEICYKLTFLSSPYSFTRALVTGLLTPHDKTFIDESLDLIQNSLYAILAAHRWKKEINDGDWAIVPSLNFTDDDFFLNVIKVNKNLHFMRFKDPEQYRRFVNFVYYIQNEPRIYAVFHMLWMEHNYDKKNHPGSKCDEYAIRKYWFNGFIDVVRGKLEGNEVNFRLTNRFMDKNDLSINKVLFTLISQQLINQNWSQSQKDDFQNVLLESPRFLEEYKCAEPVIVKPDCEN